MNQNMNSEIRIKSELDQNSSELLKIKVELNYNLAEFNQNY